MATETMPTRVVSVSMAAGPSTQDSNAVPIYQLGFFIMIANEPVEKRVSDSLFLA